MKKRSLLLVCLIACIACALAFAQEKPAPKAADPKAEFKMAADRGMALWSDPSLGTNGKTCATCHMEPGKLAGVVHRFPKYQAMAKKVITIDQMVNMCIVNSMNGKALAADDQRMADIVAYMASKMPPKEMPPKAKEEMKKPK
jgi:cytochrome c